MTYLDHIKACNNANPARYVPFRINGMSMGALRPDFATALVSLGSDFVRDDNGEFCFAPQVVNLDERNRVLDTATRALRAKGVIRRLHGERFDIRPTLGHDPLCQLDRSAMPYFGFRSWGVHMNGYVRKDNDIHMWVAHRAKDIDAITVHRWGTTRPSRITYSIRTIILMLPQNLAIGLVQAQHAFGPRDLPTLKGVGRILLALGQLPIQNKHPPIRHRRPRISAANGCLPTLLGFAVKLFHDPLLPPNPITLWPKPLGPGGSQNDVATEEKCGNAHVHVGMLRYQQLIGNGKEHCHEAKFLPSCGHVFPD